MTDASDPRPVKGTDTEYLGDRERLGTSPVTHHGVEPVTGTQQGELSPRPSTPEDLRPLRTYTASPLGIPLQIWIGGAVMLAIIGVMLL